MTTASCLITSTPDFESPNRTPPFLVAEGASPDPRQIVVVQPDKRTIEFSAFLRSEDDKDDVETWLLVNYGTQVGPNPYGTPIPGNTLLPSTMDDRTRKATATWTYDSYKFERCNRFTLMVSHAFDNNRCPLELSDSDSITWTVYICLPGEDCPPQIDPALDCVPLTPAACPQFSPELTSSSSTSSEGGATP